MKGVNVPRLPWTKVTNSFDLTMPKLQKKFLFSLYSQATGLYQLLNKTSTSLGDKKLFCLASIWSES